MDFYREIISHLRKKDFPPLRLTLLKRRLALKYHLKAIPANSQILLHASPNEVDLLRTRLLTKPVRSLSGVAPVAIMTKPFPCPHGRCSMCPGGIKSPFGDVPQSYTGKEPATLRGIRNHFDPYLQVFNRLEQYALLGHNFEKVELIVMGGTFPSFPPDYQEDFVKLAFKAMNDFSLIFCPKRKVDYPRFKNFFELPADHWNDQARTSRIQDKLKLIKKTNLTPALIEELFKTNISPKKFLEKKTSLEKEQKRNENTKVRGVALCLETRPDYGLLKHGRQMLKLGATRVELGIQSVDDEVLRKINRGHSTKETKESLRILRDLGFKVAGHYMPGLPGVDRKKDLAGMKQLFSQPDYRPDMLKIYPCLVAKGTPLFEEYQQGKFLPLNTEEAAELIAEFKKIVPEYCRIMRVQRDIPTDQLEAGVKMTNLRQYLKEKYQPKCRCLRCREPGHRKINWEKVKIKVTGYEASKGKEFFIAAEDLKNDFLLGFVRLRFPSQFLKPEITKKSALIRELHVYGTATGIGKEGSVQHQGWGKKLMKKAEEIARVDGKDKIVVISGVGAREYYRKLGYKKEGSYMTKKLKS